MKSLTEYFSISQSDCDSHGIFLPSAAMQMAQIVAGKHAQLFGLGFEDMLANNTSWVLLRYHGKFIQNPLCGEKLSIESWHKGCEGLIHYRDFIFRNQNNEPVIVITTANVVLNLSTRRLQREEHSERLAANVLNQDAIAEHPDKIVSPSDMILSGNHVVCTSDLDVNNHTNNARYMALSEELLARQMSDDVKVREFFINFNHESRLGDSIDMYTSHKAGHEMFVEGKCNGCSIFQTRLVF